MANEPGPAITVQPRSADWIDAAVVAGGGRLVEPADATAMVWTHSSAPEDLASAVADHPQLDWVQLPWAGIEPYLEVLDPGRTWTNAKEVYADPVAELAHALLLAGFRRLDRYARADTWTRGEGRNLFGARVTILGGGGIAKVLVDLLAPYRCEVTVVRRTAVPMAGVSRVLGEGDLHEGLRDAEAVVLALPLLPSTIGLIGAEELALLAPGAHLVNVARGRHVDTDALVEALESGQLGGAGLDVTDPEPLPDGHPLWSIPSVIITPHCGNTREMAKPLLGARIAENVRRYGAGEPLVGVVDLDLGY
ncbi:MAG: hydroxyacid dehydrogenase [Actinobacteria bacterium]|nr:hydroxyacid dehydrogenase [Actinomycetota bacterium]